MNNQRIVDWADTLFANYTQTPAVAEQKEELTLHLTEKVKEYMATGKNFDQAFDMAMDDLGDPQELLASFADILVLKTPEDQRQLQPWEYSAKYYGGMLEADENAPEAWKVALQHHKDHHKDKTEKKTTVRLDMLVALSPFVYIGLGFLFGWWAWAWVIIPMAGVLFSSGMFFGPNRDVGNGLTALSPFVYILLGFFFGWWAWGWIIIPISAIVFNSGIIKKER